MNYARKHEAPVILPTGQIVIFGGNLRGAQSPVLYPEMFDPVSETWTVWPPATVPRMYHGLALLLQDGRVWTAGTTPNAQTKEVRVEIFNPWYTSETRPTISGTPTGGAYGNTITITTPNAADISKVSLVRVSATTHHYNSDQRLIWLQIVTKTSSSLTVKAPINSKLAPPGYYLVHVLNGAGVPSKGTFIQIPGSADVPPSDTTAPTVAITSPANGATVSGPSTGVTINVAGNASDNSGGSGIQKVEVQVGSNPLKLATATGPGGSGDWSTWSASDVATTQGNTTILARATDNAGNTKDATITVTVAFSAGSDTTAPTVAITSPANGATVSGPSTGVTINVAGNASDNSGGSGIQKVEVQVGSNPLKLATATGPGGSGDWSTWSASDVATTQGNTTILARATDNAGNTKDATITVTVAFSAGGTYTSIYSVAGVNYGALYTGSLKRVGE